MLKWYCDICGEEIKDTKYSLIINPVDINSIDLQKHLCKNCLKELENTIKFMQIKNEHEKKDKNNVDRN